MRTSWIRVALLLCLAMVACKKSQFPDNAPYYPGALVGGMKKWDLQGYSLSVNQQQTPDDMTKVEAFFQEKLGKRTNWKKLEEGPDTYWSDGNMLPGVNGNSFEGKPVDPTRPGRIIRIANLMTGVIVEVWVAVPLKP